MSHPSESSSAYQVGADYWPVPTLAGDVEQSQEPESLHLHLSMSHPSESSSAYQVSRDTDYWPVPTLAGDVEQSQEPESLHLHLSMSHPSESSSAYQVILNSSIMSLIIDDSIINPGLTCCQSIHSQYR